MATALERSDNGVLELLLNHGPLGIAELTAALHVTATAVRQRLVRLMAQGLVQRESTKSGRGRPGHRYSLTEKARHKLGSNFADLTIALWREVRSIKDRQVRGGLLKRLAKTLAAHYGDRVTGATTVERMQSVKNLMDQRNVPFTIERNGSLPVLTAVACPYSELAEQDRGICAVEKMLFSELLGEHVRLSECRLDGASCCRFETN